MFGGKNIHDEYMRDAYSHWHHFLYNTCNSVLQGSSVGLVCGLNCAILFLSVSALSSPLPRLPLPASHAGFLRIVMADWELLHNPVVVIGSKNTCHHGRTCPTKAQSPHATYLT